MSRRVVLLLALAALAVLGTAAVPWTLSSGGLVTAVADDLRANFGIDFKVEGRSTIAVLPLPRVKFENVSLVSAGREIRVAGATLRAELRLWPLLLGRVELSDASLHGARISASAPSLAAVDWRSLLQRRDADPQDIPRVVLTSSSIRWAEGDDGILDDVNLVAAWPDTAKAFELVGSASWRGEAFRVTQFSLRPALLAADRPSPFVISAVLPSGRLSLTGEARMGDDPGLTGQGLVQASSVRELSRWSGVALPLGPMIGALSISGDFTLTRRRLSWPAVTVTLGPDRLEGTVSVRLEGERPVIAGTLAAETLDLSPFVEPFTQARTFLGTWREDDIELARTTQGDLDLRLSATSAQLGAVKLSDMAANVLVRPGQIEASLGRAGFYDGSLKGRLIVAKAGDATEVKTQATYADVDLGAFMSAIGEPRWITGRAQGQVQLDGTGHTAAEIVRQSQGRASLTIKAGELVGIGLDDLVRRIEKRPLAASLEWQGGRTAFDVAQVALNVGSGIGEITEGRMQSSQVVTTLQGRVLLAERALDVKAMVDPATPAPASSPMIMFGVNGGWDAVRITPDAKSLIQRSGAARPLFGPLPAKPAGPVTTAQ